MINNSAIQEVELTSVVKDDALVDINTQDEWSLRHTLQVYARYQQQPWP